MTKPCDNCGASREDVMTRADGGQHCLPCWRGALAHGHLHVDHDPMGVPDCPVCESECWTVSAIVRRMQLEIQIDMRMGRVLPSVRTFAELHDYVDANEYGGLTRDDCPFQPDHQADIDVINQAQTLINVWLAQR